MKFLRNCFSFACFSAALGMTVWWCYKYSKDEDYSEINYKSFGDTMDVETPMLSFCFVLPVDFDFGNFNISNFTLAEEIKFRNGTESIKHWPDFLNAPLETTYCGYYYYFFIKCFGLRLKDKNTKYGTFMFTSWMFPNGIRPKNGNPKNPFQPVTFIHFPNQLFLQRNTEKTSWRARKNNLGLVKSFTITSMDVLKARDKNIRPCIGDEVKYDEQVMKKHVERFGCKPAYLNIFGNYSICTEKDKIQEARFDSYLIQNVSIKPCTTLENVNYRYEEEALESESYKNLYIIQIVFPDTFKEIVHMKAVDIQTVIGNAGGYVGLFCGKYCDIN